MPSVAQALAPNQSHASSKKTFSTVLGLHAVFKDSSDTESATPKPAPSRGHSFTISRKSVDTTRFYQQRRKQRLDRASVASVDFFEPAPAQDLSPLQPIIKMTKVDAAAQRRTAVRLDTQDGPWSVSAAETPHDSWSYSLYIKSECLLRIVTSHLAAAASVRCSWSQLGAWLLTPCIKATATFRSVKD